MIAIVSVRYHNNRKCQRQNHYSGSGQVEKQSCQGAFSSQNGGVTETGYRMFLRGHGRSSALSCGGHTSRHRSMHVGEAGMCEIDGVVRAARGENMPSSRTLGGRLYSRSVFNGRPQETRGTVIQWHINACPPLPIVLCTRQACVTLNGVGGGDSGHLHIASQGNQRC